MASIPTNGYAEVMAGTNNYTGSNSYDASCPKTAIVPVASDDLCNKLYVDAIVAGGTVVSVSGGTNIVMSGTAPAPIVNLRNPLTAELNIGAQSIRDSAGAVGTNGQVLTAGTGGQALWGAGVSAGVTSITAGLNIGIDSTISTAPVVRVLQPLTSVLDIGTQNITGTVGTQTFIDSGVPNTQTQVSATGISVYDAAAGSNVTNITKTGQYFQNATDTLTFTPVSIAKSVGASALSISSVASNIELNTPNVVTTSGSFQPATILDTFASAAGTVGQVLSSLGGAGTKWIAAGGGGAGTLDATLALGNTATGTYANITLTDTDTGGQANPILTLVNTAATGSVAMEVYKNNPAIPVASGDVLFNQSVYGRDSTLTKQEYTRISHTIRDGTGGSEDGSIELSCFTAGAVANFIQINGLENEVNFNKPIDMVGNNIRSSTGSMTLTTALSTGLGNISATAKAGIALTASTGISSTTSTGNIALTATAGNVSISSSAAGSNSIGGGQTTISGIGCNFNVTAGAGIQTGQAATPARSILRTGHTNAYSQYLDYYPTYVVENTASTTQVSLPYMPYQNLIIVNSGVGSTYSWSDTGSALAATPTAMIRASSGCWWVGVQGYIYVFSSSAFSSPPLFVYDIQPAGVAMVFYEMGGFMFVGGLFTGVVGQPRAQFSLMRFSGANTNTPAFDPIFSASGEEGFNGNVNAITGDAGSGILYVGGLFSATVPPPPTVLENLCIVGNVYAGGGSQTYTNDVVGVAQFAANGEILAMEYYGGNVYYGGNFTQVASGFQLINWAAFYTPAWASIPTSSNGTIGQGNFNSSVYSFQMSVDGSGKLMFCGDFNFTENSQVIKYGGYIDTATPINPCEPFGIATLAQVGHRNTMNTGGTLNILVDDDNRVWYGTDVNLWEDGGIAQTPPAAARGIIYESGAIYGIFDTHLSVRLGSPLTSSAVFELPSQGFKTPSGSWSKATVPEYASQHFVADALGTYWHAVGTPISTFSN